jgi:hypothetical protein
MAQFWEQLKFVDRPNNAMKAAQKKEPALDLNVERGL